MDTNTTDLNEFTYSGVISELGDQLIQKNGTISGRSITLAKMGSSLSFWCPHASHPNPVPGESVIVSGKLIMSETGWPKVKVLAVVVEEPAETEAA